MIDREIVSIVDALKDTLPICIECNSVFTSIHHQYLGGGLKYDEIYYWDSTSMSFIVGENNLYGSNADNFVGKSTLIFKQSCGCCPSLVVPKIKYLYHGEACTWKHPQLNLEDYDNTS